MNLAIWLTVLFHFFILFRLLHIWVLWTLTKSLGILFHLIRLQYSSFSPLSFLFQSFFFLFLNCWLFLSCYIYVIEIVYFFYRIACGANDFKCNNGHCIPASKRCDRTHDCQDGSDERDCTYGLNFSKLFNTDFSNFLVRDSRWW